MKTPRFFAGSSRPAGVHASGATAAARAVELLAALRPNFGPKPGAPLSDDSAARFLGLISGLMCFLAALALAAALAVSDMAARWSGGLAGGLTVQVAAVGAVNLRPLPERVEKTLEIVRNAAGVRSARLLEPRDVAQLLEPWLGADAAADPSLPMPALIEAQVAGTVDVAGLRARLDAARLGGGGLAATVDDHAVWLADLRSFAGAAAGGALAVVVLIFGAGVVAVVFAVRAGLAINHGVVRLLHLMGASDDYISRQFEHHVGGRVLRGGAVGVAAAAAALLALDHAAGGLRATLTPSLSFSWGQWAALSLVAPGMAAAALMAARWTVRRRLEDEP